MPFAFSHSHGRSDTLGGYLYSKDAPPPGHQQIWEGWTRFTIISEAYDPRDYLEPPSIAAREELRS